MVGAFLLYTNREGAFCLVLAAQMVCGRGSLITTTINDEKGVRGRISLGILEKDLFGIQELPPGEFGDQDSGEEGSGLARRARLQVPTFQTTLPFLKGQPYGLHVSSYPMCPGAVRGWQSLSQHPELQDGARCPAHGSPCV
jgi:hypothetical protein